MTPIRAQELIRDFIRNRHMAILGWPDASLLTEEDASYLRMLESEYKRGKIGIEGREMTWADFAEICDSF